MRNHDDTLIEAVRAMKTHDDEVAACGEQSSYTGGRHYHDQWSARAIERADADEGKWRDREVDFPTESEVRDGL